MLQSEKLVLAATALALLLLVLAGALCGPPLLPFRPEQRLYSLVRWEPSLQYPRWWGARCDAAIRGLSLPAGLGMYQSIHDAYARHRGLPLEQQQWAAALVLSLASDGVLLARPLLVGGLIYFLVDLAKRTRMACRQLFTRFGERVLDLQLEEVR